MTRVSCTAIILCQLLALPILGGRSQEESPFLEMASAFLQNMGDGGGSGNANGLAAIGSLVGTLMQGDNAKNLGAMFGQNGGGAGDVLAGLGSLLGNQEGNFDPNVIGSMISMFAQQMGNNEPAQPKPNDRKKRKAEQENGFDMENILSVVSSFVQNKNAAKILPMLVNTISAFSDSETGKFSHNHEDHAHFLPPFFEKLHVFWDALINSEFGKALWFKSGLQKVTKSFTGPDGSLSFELVMKSLENHAFRRYWIKTAAVYLTDTVMHLSKPEVYQTYMVSGQFLLNGFLTSQGFPKTTHLNFSQPEKSITALINHVLKTYLDVSADASSYVNPAVEYIKSILRVAQTTSQTLVGQKELKHTLVDRITDSLNMEVIEPVLRVYRAYKHSVHNPQCQEHLMCLVNRQHDKDQKGLPGLKRGLTKISSMIASAALSFQNGKGFWDLYTAIQNDVNCQAEYPADCSAFHEHEMKVTTEVYHSEL